MKDHSGMFALSLGGGEIIPLYTRAELQEIVALEKGEDAAALTNKRLEEERMLIPKIVALWRERMNP